MQPVLGEAKPTAQSARAHHQLMSLLLLLLHDDDVTSRRGDRLGKFLEIPTSDASAAKMQRCHLASTCDSTRIFLTFVAKYFILAK